MTKSLIFKNVKISVDFRENGGDDGNMDWSMFCGKEKTLQIRGQKQKHNCGNAMNLAV